MSLQLAPDIEAGIRTVASLRGMEVDVLVTRALMAYLAEPQPSDSVPRPDSFPDRSREIAWAANPDPRFLGKWVVLDGNRVEASGDDPVQLYEEVRSLGLMSPFLIFVSAAVEELFVGGWID